MGASCDDGMGIAGDGCGEWVACERAGCVGTDWSVGSDGLQILHWVLVEAWQSWDNVAER